MCVPLRGGPAIMRSRILARLLGHRRACVRVAAQPMPLSANPMAQPTTTSISTAAPSGRAATPIAVRAG